MRDERLLLGFVAFHVLVAAPGLLALYAVGLVPRRPLWLLASAGPSYVVGVVIVGVPLIALTVVGVGVGDAASLGVLAVVTVLTAICAVRANRRTETVAGPGLAGERPRLIELVIGLLVLGGVALYFVVGARAFTNLPTLWDDANIWSLKALGLFYNDGLSDGLARNPDLSGVHLDYPILQPLLEASFFRAIGGVDLRLWHAELWLLFGALIWTMAWLLAPLGRRWLWAFVLATLAPSGILITNITLGDADTTMAAFVGCGALAFGIWLERGQRSHAVLGAVFLAGAANVKNEGLVFAVAIGVALLLVSVGRMRGRWKDLSIAAAILAASVLAWQLWVLGNEAATRGTPAPWQVIDNPGYLLDRSEFLWRGMEQIAAQVTNTAEWGFVVPALLVLASVLVIVGGHRTVACFYLLASVLAFFSVAYTYWVTPISDLGGFESRTGPRIVLGVVFIAGAGLAHLIQLATAEPAATAERPGAVEDPVAARA